MFMLRKKDLNTVDVWKNKATSVFAGVLVWCRLKLDDSSSLAHRLYFISCELSWVGEAGEFGPGRLL